MSEELVKVLKNIKQFFKNLVVEYQFCTVVNIWITPIFWIFWIWIFQKKYQTVVIKLPWKCLISTWIKEAIALWHKHVEMLDTYQVKRLRKHGLRTKHWFMYFSQVQKWNTTIPTFPMVSIVSLERLEGFLD